MSTKIYQLYHNKERATLKVSPMRKAFYNTNIDKMLAQQDKEYVLYYNTFYLFSFSRKALVQLARNMKEEWIAEAESKVEMYKSIKI